MRRSQERRGTMYPRTDNVDRLAVRVRERVVEKVATGEVSVAFAKRLGRGLDEVER